MNIYLLCTYIFYIFYVNQAKNAARAKQLAAKFESWEPEKQSNNNAIAMLESEHASIDSTKSLRAKFESLKTEAPKEKARPKVNRFVVSFFFCLNYFCVSIITSFYEHRTNILFVWHCNQITII